MAAAHIALVPEHRQGLGSQEAVRVHPEALRRPHRQGVDARPVSRRARRQRRRRNVEPHPRALRPRPSHGRLRLLRAVLRRHHEEADARPATTAAAQALVVVVLAAALSPLPRVGSEAGRDLERRGSRGTLEHGLGEEYLAACRALVMYHDAARLACGGVQVRRRRATDQLRRCVLVPQRRDAFKRRLGHQIQRHLEGRLIPPFGKVAVAAALTVEAPVGRRIQREQQSCPLAAHVEDHHRRVVLGAARVRGRAARRHGR